MNLETVKRVKKSKPFTAIDAIVIAVIAGLIGVFFWLVFCAPAASTVTVSENGVKKEYSLGKDAEIRLEHLTVHIEGGYVWVTDSDCKDGTCEHTGKISRAGQSIVCLPNNVVITIGGKGDLDWELGRS